MGMLVSSLGVLVKKKNQREYFFNLELDNEEQASLVVEKGELSSVCTPQDIIRVIEAGFILPAWDDDEPDIDFDSIIECNDISNDYSKLKRNILESKSIDEFEYIILLTNDTYIEGKEITWIKYNFDTKVELTGEKELEAFSRDSYVPSEEDVLNEIRNAM